MQRCFPHLPGVRSGIRAAGELPRRQTPQNTPKRKVAANDIDFLIVDDSRDAADSLATVLQLLGHPAQAVYSGAQALACAGSLKPLCVMLDIGMPGMDGLDLARALRREFGDDVVLVAVTGHSPDHPRVAETFELVDHYFTKPVSVEALRQILPAR